MPKSKSKTAQRRTSGHPVAQQSIKMLADWTVDGRARKKGEEFSCPAVFAAIAIARGKAAAATVATAATKTADAKNAPTT